MQILFSEEDLEPVGPAPAPETGAKPAAGSARPKPDHRPEPQTGSLFGELEDELGLEPVFAPAPTAGIRERAEALFSSGPAPAAPDWLTAPAPAPLDEAVPAGGAELPGCASAEAFLERLAVEPPPMPEAADAEPPAPRRRGRRKTGAVVRDDTGSARIREDGCVVEVDPVTCNDPEVLARERERRFGKRCASERKPQKKRSLMMRAVDSLSRSEQTRRELGRKLMRGLEDGETRESVTAVLDRLESLGLQSDERFAEMKVRSAAARMGDRKIRMELRRSGVDDETARAAIEAIEEPEEIRAWRIWSRRWSEPPADRRERERMIRYLSYRGFGMSAIQKVLRGEVQPPDDDAGGW